MKAKALVDLATKEIISWGYSDFAPQVIPGQVEQFEDANEQLPDAREFCYWDGQRTQVVGPVKYAEIREMLAKRVPNMAEKLANTTSALQILQAKAKLDSYLALTDAQWTQAKAIEAIKFQLQVLERIVRYLL